MDYQKTYTYPTSLENNDSLRQPQMMPAQQFQQPFTAQIPQTPMQPLPPVPQPFIQQPTMPQLQPAIPVQPVQPIFPPIAPPIIQEQSYIENILRLNKGKVGTFYFTYTDSNEWRDRVYKGVIEAAGRDHLIISDPKTGKRYLFQMIYFQWAEFDEEINYEYPFK